MPRVGLILGLVAALGLAACGGHSPTQPTPPPSGNGGGGNGGGGTTDPPPPPPPPPTLKITKILCFGDSITAGTVQPPLSVLALDAGQPQGYPFKLQTLETARYTSQTITVWNDGQAGEQAEDPVAFGRFSQDVGDNHPDVILLMEGSNDLGNYSSSSPAAQRTGITATVNSMEDMVREGQRLGATVFVATILSQRSSGSRGGAADLIAPYNQALKAMAAKKGATLVDVNAQFPLSQIGADGLHPTEDGYETIAEIFQAALAAAYEVPPASTTSRIRK
jgi:lysophospholipase L1-like esterase